MLYRDAYSALLNWKNSGSNKKCLMVRGARQVGKTYLIKHFGENEYKNVVEINFLERPNLKAIFQGDLDVKSLLMNLTLYMPETHLEAEETLLFLDEIQECPEAVTSLKFWALDGRFDVIVSGSMLGIDYKRPSSYPVGYVDYLDMTALSFKEFLIATGVKQDVLDYIKDCYANKRNVSNPINQKMMELLRTYMVVGGMPDVVLKYLETNSYAEVDKVQKRILTDYRYDIAHYASADLKIKAEACYFTLPQQLGKSNHKFQYSVVEKGSNARKYGSSVEWLTQADLVSRVYNVDPLRTAMSNHKNENDFRLYPTDIGLLIGMMDYSIKSQILGQNASLLADDTKGGVYEALIADMLYKSGKRDLFFSKNTQGTFEIEFVLETEEGLVPIEVKSGRSRSKSLDNLLKKEEIPYGYKLIDGNLGVFGKKITLPLYMAGLI